VNRKNPTQELDVCPPFFIPSSLSPKHVRYCVSAALDILQHDEAGAKRQTREVREELIIVARAKGKIATDTYAIEEAKRAAAGLLPARDEKKVKEHEPRHEAATDEQVYDRFKKRLVPLFSLMDDGLMSRMRR
jgi:hypothetical protein